MCWSEDFTSFWKGYSYKHHCLKFPLIILHQSHGALSMVLKCGAVTLLCFKAKTQHLVMKIVECFQFISGTINFTSGGFLSNNNFDCWCEIIAVNSNGHEAAL